MWQWINASSKNTETVIINPCVAYNCVYLSVILNEYLKWTRIKENLTATLWFDKFNAILLWGKIQFFIQQWSIVPSMRYNTNSYPGKRKGCDEALVSPKTYGNVSKSGATLNVLISFTNDHLRSLINRRVS